MTIAITSSGIALDGPLVAGEKVAVTVSGLALAAEDKPTLALLARFPDALLASVELAESETAGTWTGELDTATKQTALFFATARADERRDAALELVAGRVSLARLTVPMANSALCPKPDGSPFASPVYIPVPGPPGQGGDPYDQAPEMDGEASAGTADEYARGDHRHPTDTSRMAATATGVDIPAYPNPNAPSIEALITNVASTVPGAGDETPLMDGEGAAGRRNQFSREDHVHPTDTTRQAVIEDLAAIRSGAAAGATAVQPSALATVATSGLYNDLTNKPTIPAAQVNADWNASSGVAQILNKPTIPDVSGKADSTSIAPAFSASSTYAVGDYCTHEGLLYKCSTAVSTAGAWDSTKWTEVAVVDEMGSGGGVTAVKNAKGVVLTPDADGAVTLPGHKIWAGTATCTASGSTSRYAVTPFGDDFALEEGCVVVFKAPATNPGTTTELNVAGTGNKTLCRYTAQGWQTVPAGAVTSGAIVVAQFTLGSSYAGTNKWVQLGWEKAPLASPAFTGTPTAPTANAGTNTTQIATTAFVQTEARYALTAKTPSVSGTAATVACEDRAINDFTVATGITSLTITPPAAVTGRARDFFCRVTLTDASLPTVTLSGGTIDIGASEVAGMTQGVNLLMFTEIASGHWLASRRSAS